MKVDRHNLSAGRRQKRADITIKMVLPKWRKWCARVRKRVSWGGGAGGMKLDRPLTHRPLAGLSLLYLIVSNIMCALFVKASITSLMRGGIHRANIDRAQGPI